MLVKNFHDLPKELQCEAVRPYFEILNQRRTSLLCKSIFDRVMAAGMLITLSPIFLILAIMIKRDSEGEVFFRQTRVTQYGRTFGIYKFRTMVKNAESLGAQVTSQNDMRVTKVGNMLRSCRLDELPQLFNILLGQMSFVGPRPVTEPERKKYGDTFKYIFSVTPGLSGMWQISGRSSTGYDERIFLDTFYIQNWSIWLDIWIILQTIIVVVTRKGAY